MSDQLLHCLYAHLFFRAVHDRERNAQIVEYGDIIEADDRDVFSDAPALMFNTEYDWKTELGSYINASKTFTPAEGVNEADIPEGYVDQIRAIVRNKIRFCKNVLEVDFFKHVKEYLPANAK